MSAAERTSDRAFLAVAALLFLGSAALTIRWCASMAAMGEMVMPGGWAMSMTWMRMPGQTWPGAAASFVAMWAAMTAAMMLPSLVPMLRRYRCAAAVGPDRAPAIAALPPSLAVGREMRLGALTALVAAGYFCVWTVLGAAVFAVGAALASLAMREPALARLVPAAAGAVVALAGGWQLCAWKERQLTRCRGTVPPGIPALRADARTAWRHGLRLGLRCTSCCAGLTTTLLAVGVMDLRAMAAVAVATSVERLAPGGERAARVVGVLTVGAGLLTIGRSLVAG
ncbi:MAG TPA: DUF2182 domain-containing protein [Gammaproteobacteria bacterium]|nr:DUF2182 domain-containing protein [Gammaproteobacteria bacterium]